MRHTEACDRWLRHEMRTSTSSDHATADFIGETWLTTTRFRPVAASTRSSQAARTR
jgi:hypothetical protein